MKICWDNLENVTYCKEDGWFRYWYWGGGRRRPSKMIYVEECLNCGEPFFARSYGRMQEICSRQCTPKPLKLASKRELHKIAHNWIREADGLRDTFEVDGPDEYSAGYARALEACAINLQDELGELKLF